MKITHGIYLEDTIVENKSGKAYLKVISILDEEVEVQVPTLRLKFLTELLNSHESNLEAHNDWEEIADMQTKPQYPKDDQIHCKVLEGTNEKEINVNNKN